MNKEGENFFKGFALSLDSIFAVIIVIIFLSAFFFLSAKAEGERHSLLILEKQTNDMLITLDKTGDLSTLNTTLIANSINSTMPLKVKWRMNLTYYNYTSGNFSQANSTSFGSNPSASKELAVAQREFLIFSNRTIIYYGVARLETWTR